jgi:hypothetical protein
MYVYDVSVGIRNSAICVLKIVKIWFTNYELTSSAAVFFSVKPQKGKGGAKYYNPEKLRVWLPTCPHDFIFF